MLDQPPSTFSAARIVPTELLGTRAALFHLWGARQRRLDRAAAMPTHFDYAPRAPLGPPRLPATHLMEDTFIFR